MLLIRPCQMSDLDDLMALSRVVGRGMTSMPADEAAWLQKIEATERAFSDDGAKDAMGTYFMVLEDQKSGRIIGTTAIYTGIGLDRPFYSYKVSTLVSSSNELSVTRQARVLSMVNDYTGATEVGSLFVLPEFRRPGMGQFLSRARFLTMADFPQRFGETVMAELRGWQDEKGDSPLWENLGRQFFGIDFQDAVNTVALKGTQFISDLMPKYPIYIDLLPEAARDVIGKPNDSSAPALHMLKKEGFQFTGYVDLFDGGPSVQCPVNEVHTVRDSHYGQVRISYDISESDDMYMISNGNSNNYRVMLAPARMASDGSLMVSRETVEGLGLNHTAPNARYIPFKRNQQAHAVAA